MGYKMICIRTTFDNKRLWHVGDEADSDKISKGIKRHFKKAGGTADDLLNSVEKESTTKKKTTKKVESEETEG